MDSNGLAVMAVMFIGFGATYILGLYSGFKRTKKNLIDEIEQIRKCHKVNAEEKTEVLRVHDENAENAQKVLTGYQEVLSEKAKLTEWHGQLSIVHEKLKRLEEGLVLREANLLEREKQ